MIVLDTNVISELARDRADDAVVAWADVQPLAALHVTCITEAELLYGLACLPDGRRRQQLYRAVETVFSTLLSERVLPFDRAAARAYAAFAAERRRRGRPIDLPDAQIAAIAMANGATAIATRNVADFDGCGLALLNPWQS